LKPPISLPCAAIESRSFHATLGLIAARHGLRSKVHPRKRDEDILIIVV
jgi:hypothetical protein